MDPGRVGMWLLLRQHRNGWIKNLDFHLCILDLSQQLGL